MVKIEESGLLKEAALWPNAGYDRHGIPRVSAAIEIMTNWDKARRESITPEGTPIGTDAVVMVDRDIAEGSLMREGELDGVPDPPDNLYEVVGYNEVTDIKGRDKQRNVVLRRWKKDMAEIV